MLKQNDRQPPLLLRNRNDRPIAINTTPHSQAAMTCFIKVAACREENTDLHPVHARNVGLLPAWEHWAAQTEDEPGRQDAARLLTMMHRRFSESDDLMTRILLRNASSNPDIHRDAAKGAIEGDVMFAVASIMYWCRPNVLIELTPALEQLMTGSDLGEEVPAGQLRPPMAACYIRFGATMAQAVSLPAQGDVPENHIEGAYVFESGLNGKRAISIVAIYTVNQHGPMGISSLDFVIDDEQESLLGTIRRQCANEQSEPYIEQQIRLTLLCTKVLLYRSLAQARRVSLTPYSAAVRRLQGIGPRKAAKLRRQAERLYDRVLLGPSALPVHLRGAGGEMSPHWRRGHFRMQPYGPQMSLRKIIFIAPTLVRADRTASDEFP